MRTLFPIRIYSNLDEKEYEVLLKNNSTQIDVNEREYVTLKSGNYLTLDYGKETNGSARILTYQAGGKKLVRIRYAESLSETMSEIGEKGETNDHSTRDFIVELQNYSDMTYQESGFRYIRIDCLEDTELKIKSILLRENIDETPFEGKLESNSETLNKIFDTASYTVRLCLQNNMIWDGIKRDRLVWIGDMHPEVTSLLALYGDKENIKNSLEHAKQYNPLPLWMNNIPCYSLWWIIINRDYYYQNGDKEYLQNQLEYLNGLINQLNECIDENGHIDFVNKNTSMPYFIDWPTFFVNGDPDFSKENDSYAGVDAMMRIAIQAAKDIYKSLEIDTTVIDNILKKLSNVNLKVIKAKQISAMRILSGNYNDNDKEIISSNGSKSISTFMAGYIFEALAKINKQDLALENMLEYYGSILDKGATTFFEDYNVDWNENSSRIDELPKDNELDIHSDFGAFCYKGFRHSLCHGWSSSVIGYIIKEIVGIKILEPGMKKVLIKPCLNGLEYVNCTYPTPYGKMEINVKKVDNKLTIHVKKPKEIETIYK